MKVSTLCLLSALFLMQITVGDIQAEAPSAGGVIAGINAQRMSKDVTAKAKLTIEGGTVHETVVFDLLMKFEDGKEVIVGEILEPPAKRGTLRITWEGNNAKIDHMERGLGGKRRRLVVGPSNSFLGSAIAYADIRILEDTSYVFNWEKERIIEAKSAGDGVYGKKLIASKVMDDGAWAIQAIKYYDPKGTNLVKKAENRDLVKVDGAWRPRVIHVKTEKSIYATTLELDWDAKTVFD